MKIVSGVTKRSNKNFLLNFYRPNATRIGSFESRFAEQRPQLRNLPLVGHVTVGQMKVDRLRQIRLQRYNYAPATRQSTVLLLLCPYCICVRALTEKNYKFHRSNPDGTKVMRRETKFVNTYHFKLSYV